MFAGLDVAAFEAVVHRRLHEYFVGPDEAFAVDGKTLRCNHWSIENGLHYVRDFTFDEDRYPIRTGNGPRTVATFRSLVISLLRACRSPNIVAAL